LRILLLIISTKKIYIDKGEDLGKQKSNTKKIKNLLSINDISVDRTKGSELQGGDERKITSWQKNKIIYENEEVKIHG